MKTTSSLPRFATLATAAFLAFAAPGETRLPFKHGINIQGLDGYDYSSYHWATYVHGYDATYANIKNRGFDHVRFPVDLRKYYDSGTKQLKSNMSLIDGFLRKIIDNGMYAFLDFHGWNDLNTSVASQKETFLAIWRLVAERYKDWPETLVFELLNEPHTTEGGNLDAAALNSLQAEVIPIIRETNPTRWILAAAADWNSPWTLQDLVLPEDDGRIGVVCHCYAPMEFSHQGATWDGRTTDQVRWSSADHTETGTLGIDKTFRWIEEYKERTGIPVILNEFGVIVHNNNVDMGDVADWVSYMVGKCRAYDVPWSWWEYHLSMGAFTTSQYSYPNGTWVPEIVDNLFPADEAPEYASYADSFDPSGYAKAMEISFPGYAGSTALADFPVLVKLSESIDGFRYADFARPDGDDLRFTDSAGNLIPHEIDTWNSNGVSTVWVKVPSLTAAATITAHYGCALPVRVDPAATWNNGYVGVWHLGESALPLKDSSETSSGFTTECGNGGIRYGDGGVVGGAVNFLEAGKSRMVNAQNRDTLDGFSSFTVEAWTYQTAHATAGILSKRYQNADNASYCFYDNGSKTQINVSSNSTAVGAATLSPPLGEWNHQTYTFDAGTLQGYLNGVPSGAPSTLSVKKINASSGNLHLGNFNRNGFWSADTRNFPGKIDEVRISNVARSADWLQATHDTVMSDGFAVCAVRGVAPPVVAETEGFDNTNRLFTVTGLEAGQTATLEICGDDASSSHDDVATTPSSSHVGGTFTAVADSTGAASFDFPTVPGTLYRYSLSVGGETVASGTFLAGSWDAAGSWFATAPDGSGGIRETGGSWTTPPVLREGGNAFVSGDSAVFSLSAAARAAGDGRVFRAEAAVSYPALSTFASLERLSIGDALAVATPVEDPAGGGTPVWAALLGGGWRILGGAPAPASGAECIVRLEGDFAASSPRVRLSASCDGGASFSPLSDPETGDEWFAPASSGKPGLAGIEAQGALEIASLGGALADGAVAEAGGVRYATLSDALRAAGRGGTVTLLANATAPASLVSGRTILQGGHLLVTFDDFRGTLFLLD